MMNEKPAIIIDTSAILQYMMRTVWSVGMNQMISSLDGDIMIPESVINEYDSLRINGFKDDQGNAVPLPNLDVELTEVETAKHLEKLITRIWKRTKKGIRSPYPNPTRTDADVMQLALQQNMDLRQVYVVTTDWDIVSTLDRTAYEFRTPIEMITPGRVHSEYFGPLRNQMVFTTEVVKHINELRNTDAYDNALLFFERTKLMDRYVDLVYAVEVAEDCRLLELPKECYAIRMTGFEMMGFDLERKEDLYQTNGLFNDITREFTPEQVQSLNTSQANLVQSKSWYLLNRSSTFYNARHTMAGKALKKQLITKDLSYKNS